MKYQFCATIRDDKLETDTLRDVECEVDMSAEIDNGDVIFSTDAVYLNGKNLFTGMKHSRHLACEIAELADREFNDRTSRYHDRAVMDFMDNRAVPDFMGTRAEAAWDDHNRALMESGGTDDSAYRRDMIAAGRGHLVRS